MKFNIELEVNTDIDLEELWAYSLRELVDIDDCEVMNIGILQTLADVS